MTAEESLGDITPVFAPRGISRSDVDLSCISRSDSGIIAGGHMFPAEDLQKAKDEKLLALLNEMAVGGRHLGTTSSSDADGGGSTGVSRSFGAGSPKLVLPLPSSLVFEEDPMVRAGIEECGEVWRKVQAEAEVKSELQARLLGELRQIQERSQRQYQESSSLMQRLMAAKQTLAERLRDATEANEDLRNCISAESQGNELLRTQISDGVKGMFATCAEISDEIAVVSGTQNCLVEELKAASESQSRLQSELQKERVATWRQSTDVVMAFARGSTSSDFQQQAARGRRGSPPRSCGEVLAEEGETPSASSSAGGRSMFLRAKVAGAEEHSQLEQQIRRQGQKITELSKELALEEALRSTLDSQLLEATRWVASSGAESLLTFLKDAPRTGGRGAGAVEAAEEGPFANSEVYMDSISKREVTDDADVSAALQEAAELRRELAERDEECHRAISEENRSLVRLEAERTQLEALRDRLARRQEEEEGGLEENAELVVRLEQEVAAEQAALQNEEHVAENRRQLYRMEVEELRNDLEALYDVNDRLDAELSVKSKGCFRRRRPPDSSPSSEALRGRFFGSPSSTSGGDSTRSGGARPPVQPPRHNGGGTRHGTSRPPPPPFQPIRRQNTGDENLDIQAPW